MARSQAMGFSLTLTDLSVVRGARTLFAGLSATINAGEAVWLRAPNGAGKTTLLRAIAGLHPIANGMVSVPEYVLDDICADHIHLLGHRDPLSPNRTARQELIFWAEWMNGVQIETAINTWELTSFLDLPCRVLSAGQRRRLALARLLAAPRPIWLLDEPTAPLDAAARAQFTTVLKTHLSTGGIALIAAHDPVDGATGELRLEDLCVL